MNLKLCTTAKSHLHQYMTFKQAPHTHTHFLIISWHKIISNAIHQSDSSSNIAQWLFLFLDLHTNTLEKASLVRWASACSNHIISWDVIHCAFTLSLGMTFYTSQYHVIIQTITYTPSTYNTPWATWGLFYEKDRKWLRDDAYSPYKPREASWMI